MPTLASRAGRAGKDSFLSSLPAHLESVLNSLLSSRLPVCETGHAAGAADGSLTEAP